MGEKYGVIVWVIREDPVTFEKAKDLLLRLKETADQAEVPFAAVDFSMDSAKSSPGEEQGIYINSILYEQMEDTDEFIHLLKKLHRRQTEIYNEIDGKK